MKSLLAALLLITLRAAGQGMADGPYVLFRNGLTVIKSIADSNGHLRLRADSGTALRKIRVAGRFDVPLRSRTLAEVSEHSSAPELFFVSDVEGELEGFRKLLVANHVMDKHYRWHYGRNKLVIAGDLFDRGGEVLPVLWLLYKLEGEARAAGGDVRVILGNHDLMNLSGELRYVRPEYLDNARLLGENYMTLFGPRSLLGQWLRSKNILEKIGDQLVCHAGISPAVNALGRSVEQINCSSRSWYDTPIRRLPDSVAPLLGHEGLSWYRGYFMAPRATQATVDSTLRVYQARTIVVGHTIIIGRNPALYYHGKVAGIDVNVHKGQHHAAIYANGIWYSVDIQGRKKKLLYRAENDLISEEQID